MKTKISWDKLIQELEETVDSCDKHFLTRSQIIDMMKSHYSAIWTNITGSAYQKEKGKDVKEQCLKFAHDLLIAAESIEEIIK